MGIGKVLLIAGAVLLVAGTVATLFPSAFSRLGRLPGDIVVEREGFSFYFPLATCILVSLVIWCLSWLFSSFK